MSLHHDSLLLSSSSSIQLEILVIITLMIDAFVMLQTAAAEGVRRNRRGRCWVYRSLGVLAAA